MDNITHTLVGLMLSRAGLDRGEKGTPLMIMLAANAPDMDTYNFFIDNLEYLQVHRGYTHSLVFAPLVALIPLLRAFSGLRINGTFLALWLVHTGFGLSLAIYLLYNYISQLPREILESAFIDGASQFTIFLRLILPLSVPALASFAPSLRSPGRPRMHASWRLASAVAWMRPT